MIKLAVASHVTLVDGKQYDGIGNVLIETLEGLAGNFMFVRHSMDGLLPSEVHQYNEKNITKKRLLVISRIGPLRYLTEFIATVFYFTFIKKIDAYVGIDPLNAVAGIFLKKIRRLETAVFYTADYSVNRFTSSFLNTIYHKIDRYCVNNADQVWSVSSKIVKIRKEMGLSNDKNIFLPNVPPIEYNKYRKNAREKHTLITYGIVDKQLDFEGTIRAVANLKKDIPDIKFVIAGNGPEEARLISLAKKLRVSDRVIFKGRQTLEKTLELASRSGIGLALYTGAWAFNTFGDSTKCREYFNYGLPVISTDTHSTVDEIKTFKAGLIVELSQEHYEKAIKEVIENYDAYSVQSLKLGKKYEGIHRKMIQGLLNK